MRRRTKEPLRFSRASQARPSALGATRSARMVRVLALDVEVDGARVDARQVGVEGVVVAVAVEVDRHLVED
ncbi:MAG: hypothetical protein WDM88_00395 [Galbitalea sp.]